MRQMVWAAFVPKTKGFCFAKAVRSLSKFHNAPKSVSFFLPGREKKQANGEKKKNRIRFAQVGILSWRH